MRCSTRPRAALLAIQAPAKSESVKTHSGLISAFSLHLIRPGHLPIELGKSLSRVSEIRIVADYSDEEVTREDAASVQQQVSIFVAAIAKFVDGFAAR